MDRKVKVKGRVFKSLREACLVLGFEYGTVHQRIKSGWSIDDAFSRVEFCGKKGQSFDTKPAKDYGWMCLNRRSNVDFSEPDSAGGHLGSRFNK